MSIEVEHKFVVGPHTQAALASLGAAREGCVSFKDIYYDTNEHTISFQDLWLRQRDGAWQLKHPVQKHASKPATDQYRELESEKDILNHLVTSEALLSDLEQRHQQLSLERLVSEGELVSIAEFVTTRETWLLNVKELHLSIVLDTADFGYSVGEVEMMVESLDGVAEAKTRVRELADLIGWSVL